MTKAIIIIQFVIIGCLSLQTLNGQNTCIQSGKTWNDTQGNPINAHGGGLLYHQGTYYWYGEIKKGQTWLVSYITSWECYRTNAGGVSCYSSKNLTDWKYEGVALAPDISDSANDLHTSRVLERPKVIYNEKTKKFVMWLHVDTEDYSYARAGVAVSDNPAGPFKYLYSFRPNNQMSRDITLFKDTDGKAYSIYTSEVINTIQLCLLTDDYLKPTENYYRILENKYREAPAMFKHQGKYYLITSACTGWSPNAASYAIADSVQGPWKIIGNPCIGPNADSTFLAQSTYVIPVEGKKDAYVFMADRWNKTNLAASGYVWLPIRIKGDELSINWLEKWDLSIFD